MNAELRKDELNPRGCVSKAEACEHLRFLLQETKDITRTAAQEKGTIEEQMQKIANRLTNAEGWLEAIAAMDNQDVEAEAEAVAVAGEPLFQLPAQSQSEKAVPGAKPTNRLDEHPNPQPQQPIKTQTPNEKQQQQQEQEQKQMEKEGAESKVRLIEVELQKCEERARQVRLTGR
jgi:hypothetical protein